MGNNPHVLRPGALGNSPAGAMFRVYGSVGDAPQSPLFILHLGLEISRRLAQDIKS